MMKLRISAVLLLVGLFGSTLPSSSWQASSFNIRPQQARRSSSIWRNATSNTAATPRQRAPLFAGVVANGGIDVSQIHSSSSSRLQEGTISLRSAFSYYLVWSPGVLRKVFLSAVIMLALRYVASERLANIVVPFGQINNLSQQHSIQQRVLKATISLWNVIFLPFVASACCGLQLVINALVGASGCAGFNKWLGPLRPYFLGWMMVTMAQDISSPMMVWRRGSVVSLSGRALVAFLPELVDLSARLRRRIQRRNSAMHHKTPSDEFPIKAEVECLVPSMGCVACINKINTSIGKEDGSIMEILDTESWLVDGEGGRSRVQFSASTEEDVAMKAERITEAIRNAGFPCSIGTVSIDGRQ